METSLVSKNPEFARMCELSYILSDKLEQRGKLQKGKSALFQSTGEMKGEDRLRARQSQGDQ